jgi:xanthine dehydrogenase YagR molybdenum-binding subunit
VSSSSSSSTAKARAVPPPTPVHVGAPTSRVDGPAKVTGEARYAAEYPAPNLAYGVVVNSRIARGRIVRLDTSAALAFPGVVEVFTHENRPSLPLLNRSYQEENSPPGEHFRPLGDETIRYSGQPIALVVANDFETARHAASLVRVEYEAAEPHTDLKALLDEAFEPWRKRSGFPKPPSPRGDAQTAFDRAPFRHRAEYRVAIEHHNPMEMHAATVVWNDDGTVTVYDKTQGVMNTHEYVSRVFELTPSNVRVMAPFVGGAFGSGLRPQYQLFLAVLAARELKRPVRVVMTRQQMFTFGYRPEALQTVSLAANGDGTLAAVMHDVVQNTSQFENFEEIVVNWSGLLYHCPNVALTYRLARTDLYTPMDMRAPGAALGVTALEMAMDELAYLVKVDPLAFRLRNYTERDENEDKPFTSKELRACYAHGAERFGWGRRTMAPQSMQDGRERVGWGMATGVWDAGQVKTTAKATLFADGTLDVATASADIGTGTYTVLTQIAADSLGLGLDKVNVRLGDSWLPPSPLEGGSWGAVSTGSAVKAACDVLRKRVITQARKMAGSPLARVNLNTLVFAGGTIRSQDDPSRAVALGDVVSSAGEDRMEADATTGPSSVSEMRYSRYAHSAIFAEVKVDEELCQIRATRIVSAVAAGRILNPKTAHSQIVGGVVFGLGMALFEESRLDHRFGRFMTHNLADYHIAAHADMPEVEVIFVDEHDDTVNPLGAKGLGEIGVVGTAAAIANAVFHATGTRVRELPITLDKLLGVEPALE